MFNVNAKLIKNYYNVKENTIICAIKTDTAQRRFKIFVEISSNPIQAHVNKSSAQTLTINVFFHTFDSFM